MCGSNYKYLYLTIIWILCFLTSFSYCLSIIIQSFISYYNFSVMLQMSQVQDLPAPFPAVTICNLNPFNEMYATDYIVNNTKEGKCFLEDNGEKFSNCLNNNGTNEIFDKFLDRLKRTVANDKSLTWLEHFWYGYDLGNDMLVSCEYNQASCDATNFMNYWDNIYGNCYTFNSANSSSLSLKSSITGNKYGLKMELLVSKSLEKNF